ncbi:MAG: hypothetical protein GY757_35410 [bacterium]|nr:hypothetical protein [bacterium]
MIICGLKLTHDGAVTLIDDGKLIFNVEMENLDNNPRFTSIEDTEVIPRLLKQHGYEMEAVDQFVVDGWGGTDQDALAIQPRLEIGEGYNILSAADNGKPFKFKIAPYREQTLKHDVLEDWQYDEGLKIGGKNYPYSSYMHAAGHIMSTYSTSPAGKRGESAYILVWDGGMYPRLYYFDAKTGKTENFGPIFLFIGNIYTIFSQHFGPFKVKGSFAKDSLSVAGKVMAYIALGEIKRELFKDFEEIYIGEYDMPMGFANMFTTKFKKRVKGKGYTDEDILHTFHTYLEELLIAKLEKKIKRNPRDSKNLCMVGGCALNIKWNSAIRNTGDFNEIYVPPFPNDSGSSLGAACCALYHKTGSRYLEWDVYKGPKIIKNKPGNGWKSRQCTLKELAQMLHEKDEPVVFLNGKAELGPRALGNRSILAPAVSTDMKDILNIAKKREAYRPVSPICLEHKAPGIFDPGTKDPYMLFDHQVRKDWKKKIPAVLHLDGTARLQTITHEENTVVGELLTEYEKISGVPLLCNTSANFNGSGFFPDVKSAAKWGKVNYIWCDETLYEKEEKLQLRQT